LGLLEPTEGGAEVLGFDTLTQGDAIRRNSGALLEHTGLYERLSAEDNLNFYGRIWHIPARERRERIRQLLGDLDLYDRRDENVANWSRGMKQKLAVARTLLHNPELVFLDEPTAGLDPVAAAALREDLANLVRQHGVTVFLTTHNLTEAEKLCNRVGVIRSGKLIADGSPDELRIRQNRNQVEVIGSGFNEMLLAALRQRADVTGALIENQHLVIDLAQGANSSDLMPLLIAHKVQIDEVRKGKASLEEAFLDLMEEEQSE
jgi:ABC-2 type transport system ATP-binding protein